MPSDAVTKVTRAHDVLRCLKFPGPRRSTFERYTERHQEAHMALEDLGAPIQETQKVFLFLQGIHYPKLEPAKRVVLQDQAKLESFLECSRYIALCLGHVGPPQDSEDEDSSA